MAVKSNTSDIKKAFADFQKEVIAQMEEVGRMAVVKAEKEGNYQDRTGNLRSSNGYRATPFGLEVFNTAEYASEVESKGYEVCSSAALYAQAELKRRFEK